MTGTVLIVDDEEILRRSLVKYVENAGYRVREAATGADGIRVAGESDLDAVLLDLKLPDMTGLDVLREIKTRDVNLPVIMMTACNEVEPAVTAMKAGAYDYVKKPFDAADVVRLLGNALRASSLSRELNRVDAGMSRRFKYLVTGSAAMQAVMAIVDVVAEVPSAPVLITGETGTGKEVVAREIHNRGGGDGGRFVAINCSAISVALLESELFGHVKGAFTGAGKEKRGLFEYAAGGTLFLDEVGDMAIALQPKILRALEERAVRRVGGLEDIRVDARIVAATNRNLREAVENGAIREDLFYRLNVVTINIPPLRERTEDILPLASYFLDMFAREFKRNGVGLSQEAEAAIKVYPWPGNVRELRNVIERAVILTKDGEIEAPALALPTLSPADKADADPSLDENERRHILAVLKAAGGSRSEAARALGISRTTLWARLKLYEEADGDN